MFVGCRPDLCDGLIDTCCCYLAAPVVVVRVNSVSPLYADLSRLCRTIRTAAPDHTSRAQLRERVEQGVGCEDIPWS